VQGERAGFLIISMQGAFVGYVQLLGVADKFRGQGVGRELIGFAEQRIFRETPNVFICVSDFNQEAQRFYAKAGYQRVGELRDFIVAGRAEFLLRKTIGPIRPRRQGLNKVDGCGRRTRLLVRFRRGRLRWSRGTRAACGGTALPAIDGDLRSKFGAQVELAGRNELIGWDADASRITGFDTA
jgi:hypothetical protein